MSSSERSTWFESYKSFEYISHYLKLVQQKIRIASGFFTVRGWNLIRKYTRNKFTYLLIGIDEPGEERARRALINEIMRELRTGLDRERRQAAQALVEKMEADQFRLVDARATNHHAKLYIIDRKVALIASSNLTGQGLKDKIEAGSVIKKPREIKFLIQEFDDYFAQAQDLTAELLIALKNWLQLRTPWEIYLKTMLAFENIKPPESNYSKKPVSYQIDMIAQTLRQLKEFNGSMLVASTGLGKTVVAIHVALRLRDEKLIDNVIVIGPKAVQQNWESDLFEAGLSYRFFVRQTFDQKDASNNRSLAVFKQLQQPDTNQNFLLIIDESQEFRNRYKKGIFYSSKNRKERVAFQRLRQFCQFCNVKVLLLTGSPYAKEIDNINNQLFLLPHTAPTNALFPDLIDDAQAWKVNNTDQFLNLPVTSQLTTPYVAKYYGYSNENGDIYIQLQERYFYIPKVILHTVTFPLMLEEELSEVIKNGYFNIKNRSPALQWCVRLVQIAWVSSPLALQGVLERTIDTPGGKNSYNLNQHGFLFSRSERKNALKPIIALVKRQQEKQDIKLKALLSLINQTRETSEKILIFCERRATVFYLYTSLQKRLPNLQIVCTIEGVEKENQYQLKETKKVEELIKQFAPIANHQKDVDQQQNVDIFISTDAYGVGVNMQDASIVINYDLDWTPINLIQRAGRILRLWHSPRTVKIYTFVPTLTSSASDAMEVKSNSIQVQKRWENLMVRHGESEKLIDLPVLTTDETQEIDLPELASQVKIKSGQLNLDALADVNISPFYQHTAQLQLNRAYAETIPDDILSAKTIFESHPCLYLLLLYHQKYYAILYYPETEELVEPNLVALLDLIECNEATETATVDSDFIEALSDTSIQAWCHQHDISPEQVQRICTLYLQPEADHNDLKAYLKEVAAKAPNHPN
jgi:superfamily II DNA or RNA helicase